MNDTAAAPFAEAVQTDNVAAATGGEQAAVNKAGTDADAGTETATGEQQPGQETGEQVSTDGEGQQTEAPAPATPQSDKTQTTHIFSPQQELGQCGAVLGGDGDIVEAPNKENASGNNWPRIDVV